MFIEDVKSAIVAYLAGDIIQWNKILLQQELYHDILQHNGPGKDYIIVSNTQTPPSVSVCEGPVGVVKFRWPRWASGCRPQKKKMECDRLASLPMMDEKHSSRVALQ